MDEIADLPETLTLRCCYGKLHGNTELTLIKGARLNSAGEAEVVWSYQRGNEDVYYGLGPTPDLDVLRERLEEILADEYFWPQDDAE